MSKVPKSWKMVEIEQRCSYGFTPEYTDKLCKEWSSIKDYLWILHDKDHSDPEAWHIHCYLRFKDSVPTSAILAKLKGVCEVQQLEHIKGGWEKAMAYAVHWNAPEKHQYDESEAHSNYEWQKDAKQAIKGRNRREQIISKIASGEYKRYNITDFVTASEFVEHKRAIEAAFEYKENLQLRKKDRQMNVFYINGEAGTGKTTFAKQMAKQFGDYFISASGKDFLDGYAGQPAIILDDFRATQATLSTMLKLLDNNTASSVESRYKNKSISECKAIYITTTLTPFEMFHNVFSENTEPYEQFKRRLGTYFTMYEDHIELRRYNPLLGDFEVIIDDMPNGILDEIHKFQSVENKKEYVKRIFNGLGNLMDYAVKAIDEEEVDFDEPIDGQMSI